ncbi:protein hairless isoform X1 [Euwallacea fornicatus]|uniref:protein hairless isoform X1 n=1 Tax=Euwallacea fornicatus TaxID=995702 RepID=UPI003390559D
MHISDSQSSPTNILTKCVKMTEESHRRYGMNGSVDRNSKECHKPNYGQGGRLKFFKDGKFILELERARDGERVSWVSVPRKTFWPPPGTASSTPAYRQESSTSLSVSDDNSSIQSSPWQRDHSWKQTTPKKNISQEMALYLWRPKRKRRSCRGRGVKRRRPLSMVEVKEEEADVTALKKERRKKRPLLCIVQSLAEKNQRNTTPPRSETVVSPRKRFLREMERERTPSASSSPTSDRPGSSDDGSSNSAQKRSRVRPQTGPPTPRTPPCPVAKSDKSERLTPVSASIKVNGIEDTPVNNIKSSKNCSYSITSLLAEDHHKSSLKTSPNHSPSRFSPVVSQIGPVSGVRYCSPVSSEDRLYSESVDRLRSIELSQVEKCGYPPTYPPHPPYLGPSPYLYTFPPLPPYYGPGMYGRSGYMVPQPVYHHHPVHNVLPHSAHAVAHPVPIRREMPRPAGWHVREEGARAGVEVKEENVTDMPLNLSKHSG